MLYRGEEPRRDEEPRMFIGALASIVAAVEGAYLIIKQRAKKTVDAVVGLSQEVMNLLSAIAQGVGDIDQKLDIVIDGINAIKNIFGGGNGGPSINVQGYPPNTDTFEAFYFACTQAQPTAYPLPSVLIPEGYQVTLLARNPAGVNTGVVWVAPTMPRAQGQLQAYPLAPNATISYGVRDTSSIFVGAAVAGEGVYVTVEQNLG